MIWPKIQEEIKSCNKYFVHPLLSFLSDKFPDVELLFQECIFKILIFIIRLPSRCINLQFSQQYMVNSYYQISVNSDIVVFENPKTLGQRSKATGWRVPGGLGCILSTIMALEATTGSRTRTLPSAAQRSVRNARVGLPGVFPPFPAPGLIWSTGR